ncbi:M14 family zinc carboxypeptidase [Nonlabens ponticola]|uniref:DUF2817 domain-containing protein n=1 Tax=Nonlabens ponticola TaxID=2496866 RepID=A0A3S9MYA3_9FLAO|nr:M14 family zinc carboxypeptidase [Nonlabens ponticola]AZQ44170.1 DUF2817 domain-containing protein [Nonlabens ponticola]
MINLPRYYTYQQFENVFMKVVEQLPQDFYRFSYLGSSVQDRSIYGIELGNGNTKILAWSQMHGNESSSTRAIIKLLQDADLVEILKNVRLYIIPVLNPDGADAWTRFNANGVDLNRDAVDLTQPESDILREAIDFFEPDVAFNLHGQRSIYGTTNSSLPAQMSFLSPAADKGKSITPARIKSMAVINAILGTVGNKIPASIARYGDDFNINCIGDYCQSLGIPTVLFESGHAGNDYSRDAVTDYTLDAIKVAIRYADDLSVISEDEVVQQYQQIPDIKANYCDILIHNVPQNDRLATIAVMYHEQIVDDKLLFIPMVYAINPKEILYGHRSIDLNEFKDFNDDLVIEDSMRVSSTSLDIDIFTN